MLKPATSKAIVLVFAATYVLSFQPAYSSEEGSPAISQVSFEEELEGFLEAKEKLRRAMDSYKSANASNIQERYKSALAAYKEAAKELLNAKNEVLKEFNAVVKVANAELSKFKNSKPKPTALKLAAATRVKDAKIAEAVAQRDSALGELGTIGAEPTKPPKVPTPSPTKK